MELRRQKNAATVLVFPILNTTGTHVTGAAGLTASRTAWTDTTAPAAFTNLTNATPVELSSRGVYYVTVTSTEMNADYVYIYVTTSTAGSIAQNLLLVTKPIHSVTSVDWAQLGNPTATMVLSGTTINTVSTAVGVDWNRISNKTATVALTGTSINSVSTPLTASDPWTVSLPGSYSSGQAGYIVGNVASTVTVAGAVWDVARSAHTTVGTFGEGVTSVQGSLTGAVASVTAAVGIDWSLTQNATATAVLSGTTIASVTSSVIPDWKRMINPDATVVLSGTTINTVSTAVGLDWKRLSNKDASVSLTNTAVNSVSSAVTTGTLSDSVISSTTAVAGFYNQLADMLLGRNLRSASSGGRTVSQALARLRNRQAVSGATFTQYDTDDSTTLYTATISTTTASSLTNMDPT